MFVKFYFGCSRSAIRELAHCTRAWMVIVKAASDLKKFFYLKTFRVRL